ncbi:MAG: HEAT repeat domain-containing protein [Gemmatimonadales bacterium]|nr:HEAT repeat domain-containing protein [Gemmatimonadales bacterium]
MRRHWPSLLCGTLLAFGVTGRAAAQRAGQVDTLALLLAAEDARRPDSALVRAALGSRDPLVRQRAALTAGRIAWPGAAALLLPLLDDREPRLRATAAFALGLTRDSAAVGPLGRRLGGRERDDVAAAEVVTALARIGGAAAGESLAVMLRRPPEGGSGRVQVKEALLEAWRLGPHAPVPQLLANARGGNGDDRWRALYALGRLRHPRAADELRFALQDGRADVRAVAARALVKSYADSAKLEARAVARDLADRVAEDRDPGVRIHALQALATYKAPQWAGAVADALRAREVHVAAQAATALGELGGDVAIAALDSALVRDSTAPMVEWAALSALARLDSARVRPHVDRRLVDADPWRRAAAVEAAGAARLGIAPAQAALADSAPRVVLAGLLAWQAQTRGPEPAIIAAARRLLGHAEGDVRVAAADLLASGGDASDAPALETAARLALEERQEQDAISLLGALVAIGRRDTLMARRLDAELPARLPPTPLLRRWAAQGWPAAARAWGPPYPAEPGPTLDEYRALVRRFLLPGSPDRRVRLVLELEGNARVQLELEGEAAPRTVANFLALVDRGFFDGNRFHRIVPNFVVQDGEPQPGRLSPPSIRDEPNPLRYREPMLGMALAGPDTGTSQWFITLSPQPHLDATYTTFGRVAGDAAPLSRVQPGDRIVRLRR